MQSSQITCPSTFTHLNFFLSWNILDCPVFDDWIIVPFTPDFIEFLSSPNILPLVSKSLCRTSCIAWSVSPLFFSVVTVWFILDINISTSYDISSRNRAISSSVLLSVSSSNLVNSSSVNVSSGIISVISLFYRQFLLNLLLFL